MTTWITSDIHASHKNILKYCPTRRSGKEMPTEESEIDNMVDSMNQLIVRNWNSVVEKNDTVWILGDVCMGQIFKAPAFISCLNGKKHLVKGNHDKTLCKLKINGELAIESLFESVQDIKELTYKYGDKKVQLFMSHYPHQSWPWSDPDYRKTSVHLHGHTHCSHGLHISNGAIIDVGIDGNNLFPHNLDNVIILALNNAKNIPSKGHHDSA